MAEMNFNQAMQQLAAAKHPTPAKQPEASNTGPLDAWRKVVDALAADRRGAEAVPQPFHQGKGAVSAIDAWRTAIKPAA